MADEIINSFQFNVADALKSLTQLDRQLSATAGAFQSLASVMNTWNSRAAATADILAKLGTAGGANLGKQFDDMARGARAAEKATTDLSAAQRKLQAAADKVFTGTRTPGEAHAAQVANLNQMLAQGAITQDTHTRAVAQSAAAAEKANASTKQWMLTWETFARVIQTQALVRGLNMVRDAFTESFESALKFSRQVSEIRAIDPSRSFGQIAGDVRQLSDAFNQPLSDVAEAQYQTISDQFTTAAERADILTAANALSKTTMQSLSDASMLLTGALNAYGESSDMAGLRSAQFFKTVELGRLRVGELGAALGRVQSIAHEAGISMEELEASLVAITIGGVKAPEAATQLRGVASGFLKPTEDMKKAFTALGVTSGEEAIATWGFQGALEKLRDTADGSVASFAKLFPNIRGLAGALRLAEEGATRYKEAMEKLSQSDQAVLRKKLEEFTSTDAEKLTKEFNKIKNFFAADFGGELVASLQKVSGALGGSDGLIGVMSAVTHQVPLAAAELIGLSGYLLLVNRSAIAAKLGLVGVGGAVGALSLLPVGMGIAEAINNGIQRHIAAPQDELRQQTAQELDARKQQTEAAVREADRKNAEIVKGLRQWAAEANKVYLQDRESFQKSVKIEEELIKLSFDRVLQTRRKLTGELFTSADAAERRAFVIPDEAEAIKSQMADRKFNRETHNTSPGEQFDVFERRAKQLADLAAAGQGSAKDDKEKKLADATWSRAEAYAQLTAGAAKASGDLNAQQRAEDLLNKLALKRIDALHEEQRTQQQIASELEARGHRAEQHNTELDRMRLEIEKKFSATRKDADGGVQFKGRDELKKDLAEAESLTSAFAGKLREYGKEDFIKSFQGDPRAFEEMKRQAERSLASYDLKKIEIAPQAIADMAEKLQQSLKAIELKVPALVELQKATGLDLLSTDLKKICDEFESQLSRSTARGIRQAANFTDRQTVNSAFDKSRAAAGDTLSSAHLNTFGTRSQANYEKLENVLRLFDKLHRSANIADEDMKQLSETMSGVDLNAAFGGKAWSRDAFAEQIKAMGEQLQRQKQLQDEASLPSANQPGANQPDLEKAKELIEKSGRAATGAKDSLSSAASVNFSSLIAQLNTATTAINNLANAAANVPSMNRLMTAASGGMAFLAGGGQPRGSDTIPAMLSPGEFVMNAHSARQWSSQLIAMNAGSQPIYRESGSTVNSTVGDISVTVNGGDTGRQTARDIALGLRRELRRGTHVF